MMQTNANERFVIVSRGLITLIWRSIAVWLTVTAALAADVATAPAVWRLAKPTGGAGTAQFAELLVAACATALLLALAWLWVVTTVTVAELLIGRPRAGGGTTRRLVLLACGAAVLAGTTAPALAAGDDSSILAGLSLPDRSVATSQVDHRPAPAERDPRPASTRPAPQPRVHVVRPGESLWSIAEATSGSGGLDQRWRAIWAANHDVIGDDPDLILPGQRLRLPGDTDTDTDTDTTGRERR